MRISDWSSDVCSSDLGHRLRRPGAAGRMSDGTADTGPGSADRDAGLHVACEIVKPPEDLRRKVSTSGGPDLERIFARAERAMARSEARRVGKECVSTCRSRWSHYH